MLYQTKGMALYSIYSFTEILVLNKPLGLVIVATKTNCITFCVSLSNDVWIHSLCISVKDARSALASFQHLHNVYHNVLLIFLRFSSKTWTIYLKPTQAYWTIYLKPTQAYWTIYLKPTQAYWTIYLKPTQAYWTIYLKPTQAYWTIYLKPTQAYWTIYLKPTQAYWGSKELIVYRMISGIRWILSDI